LEPPGKLHASFDMFLPRPTLLDVVIGGLFEAFPRELLTFLLQYSLAEVTLIHRDISG
jgi:hypothetical protein